MNKWQKVGNAAIATVGSMEDKGGCLLSDRVAAVALRSAGLNIDVGGRLRSIAPHVQ